jgi:kojibiose phosphorylase
VAYIVTGTHLGNVGRQFTDSIRGPHKRNLFVSTNRGSEVYGFDADSSAVLLWNRLASPEEDLLLTEVARTFQAELGRRGLETLLIADRLNRRKIDLIPLPEWSAPPKSSQKKLYQAVEDRLRAHGVTGGLGEAVRSTEKVARALGLPRARITTDIKHIEVGLTDKTDAIDWMMAEVAIPRGIETGQILIAGDEFGPLGGFEGSDSLMMAPSARGAVFVSVGPEPTGVPGGVIHLGGGPANFRAFLRYQASIREEPRPLDLPLSRTRDEHWNLIEEGYTLAREHEIESLFSVANGYAGTRGSIPEGSPLSDPATFLAGIFDAVPGSGSVPELAVGPDWTEMLVVVEGRELRINASQDLGHRRVLDLAQGTLWREWLARDSEGRITRLHSLRLASRGDPHLLVQSLTVTPVNWSGKVGLRLRCDQVPAASDHVSLVLESQRRLPSPSSERRRLLQLSTASGESRVAFLVADRHLIEGGDLPHDEGTNPPADPDSLEARIRMGQTWRVDRLAVIFTSRDVGDPATAAVRHAERTLDVRTEDVARIHRRAWEERWRECDVEIEGDDDAQRMLRFAGYHLSSAARPEEEHASIGARALTGDVYRGHVFWDTEIFMLPYYLLTDAAAARALLMYRFHTLAAAREKARTLGYSGALFPWESAASGLEATPGSVTTPEGRILRILTGEQEHHIAADVAYAVWQYWQATDDSSFLLEAGAEILFETARFWASRSEAGPDGRHHLRHVIGPDEYHEDVDDNAYTNQMAKWNLERAVEAARQIEARWPEHGRELRGRMGISSSVLNEWTEKARRMYTGFDPGSGLIEQFADFFRLEQIDIRTLSEAGVSIDLVLGPERTRSSQVVKQADVLMLLFLLWDRFPAAVREANFRYYEPRTAHGSSLSFPIHALLAARMGDTHRAWHYFRATAEIDLSDRMGNAAGGIHAAALGGLWQAAVFGFGGLELREDGLALDPHLPSRWKSMRYPVRWRGQPLRIEIEPRRIRVTSSGISPVRVAFHGEAPESLAPGRSLEWERTRSGEWTKGAA